MTSRVWQHPYVNIFKHMRVEEWKKTSREGDVTTYMDKTLMCSVFRIRGSIPASNYILLPKTSTQSLGLTGRYLYLLFRPSPTKHFVVHLDIAAEEGQVIRVSFSNLFKEFKSTATWLHFPFLCGAAKGSVYESTAKTARHDLVGPAPSTVRWTCLMMDLQYVLSVYLNRRHSHLKTIKLCANMSVKNMFTSDLVLDPGVSFNEAKQAGLASSLGTGPMPREMSFPVPKGGSWHDLYDYIRFPSDGAKMPFDSIQKGYPCPVSTCSPAERSPMREMSRSVNISKSVQDRVSLIQQITTPKLHPRHRTTLVTSSIPELGVVTSGLNGQDTSQDDWNYHGDNLERGQGSRTSRSHRSVVRIPFTDDGGVHVYAHTEDDINTHREDSDVEEIVCTAVSRPVTLPSAKESQQRKLHPDPILRLNRIIGFGGATMKCALWTKSGDTVVYPCHAIIVSMKISSGQQRFFIGHTDKVSALTFNGNSTVLASAQTGIQSVVRVWNYLKANCLAMFKTHAHSLSSLSFSYSGGVLCGVGKDGHSKTMVVVWNTLRVTKGGEVSVLAKAHTDVDIQTMKIAFFDDTRMVSCGRDNIRLWRVRNGALRSCPVNLGEYHALDFTDVAFEEGHSADREPEDRTLFASSRSGHILEIDYGSVAIKNVRRLLPAQQPHAQRREKQTFSMGMGIAVNSISVSSAFCATGSEDGFLRLWPLDFSTVFLEAEHEGPVSLVSVSDDGLSVMAATSSGNLGYLDVSSRGYSTLMRSHTDGVLGFSVDGIRRRITTASCDRTVRVWDMDSMQQLYDFVSEDTPCSVAFHPSLQVFCCGSSSGLVRVFDIASAKLLAEHKQHRGEVVGLAFSPDGEFMYSAGSLGALALYNSSQEDHHVLRVLGNVVARGTDRAPDALTVSSDNRCLAFVGPSEYTVTIMDARSLDELLRVDVSILDVESTSLDSALKVCFSPASTGHLLVTTSANKILWISANTGRLLREVSKAHKHQCSSLAVSEDGRFLLTAGHNAVKVWDYSMQLDVNSQMFIGHSQPIHQVNFSPDQMAVVSVGDAIFFWDFLAHPQEAGTDRRSPPKAASVSPPKPAPKGHSESEVSSRLLSNGMPRRTAPLPSSPLPCLDISSIDRIGQEALGRLSLCEEDTDEVLPSPAPAGPSPRPASGSFLKVTEMVAGGVSSSTLKASLKRAADNDDLEVVKPVRPDCYKHFTPRFKTSTLDQSTATPQPGEEGLSLKAVIGYNGNGRANMVWNPETGLFAYSCGCVVVVENLHTGSQRHWLGHTEEISSLAVTNDAQTVASAAGGSGGSRSLICIWNVQDGTCSNTISYHRGAVQALAFSRDDFFFLTVGDFTDPEVALWSTRTYQLLSRVSVSGPLHDVAFSPSAASQLACVGSQGLYFCNTHTQGLDVELKVQRVCVPEELGDVEPTALCYNANSILFTGTNSGHVCAWDCNTQRCFMTWEADQGEIGVLLCRGNRLLTGSNTRRLRLWGVAAVQSMRPGGEASNTEDRGALVLLEQEMMLDGTVVCAAFDDVMDMGIVGTTAGTLWYINWVDNTSIRLISGHKSKVNDVVFSPDESHFATCGEDGSVRVWSAPSNELVVQFQVLNQSCGSACWSPVVSPSKGGACVVGGYSDGTLRIFHLASSEMELKLHPHPVAITAIQYSANGQVILSAGRDGLMAVSNPVTGVTVRIISDHKGAPITTIQCVKKQYKEFGLEGNEMWLAASTDRRVSVWAADWMKDKCELLDWLTFPAPANPEESDSLPPSLAAFSPIDPGLVVYTGYGVERELSFYSLAKKRVIKKIALSHWAMCFSLSSKGRLIAVGSKERVLKLIKSSSGRFQDFLHHSDSLQTCRFSPSGKLLFTVAYNEILLWEVHGL
ncbi:WD repeat-containing protein 90 [Coregonus clupeaformis]|uniref:WD repeat-containing protein 90 n=1 Tax=Coregonus clupeaformis TaxID=59861 RepID=UPI001BE08B24|nr:WD repeat-containing protein 90 [Coregonus clupeaformis]